MNPLAWLNPGRWMLYLALAGAVALWVRHEYSRVDAAGYTRAAAVYQAAIDKAKREAAATLASETAKVLASERALAALKNTLESNDAQHAKTIATQSARLRAMSRAAGGPGLRDPFASAGCGPGRGGAAAPAPATAASGAADPAPAGGLLSAELERFLLTQAEAADAVNRAYIACRADSYNIRSAP